MSEKHSTDYFPKIHSIRVVEASDSALVEEWKLMRDSSFVYYPVYTFTGYDSSQIIGVRTPQKSALKDSFVINLRNQVIH